MRTPNDPGEEPEGSVRRSRVVEWSPFYYGWLVLFAGTVGMMMTAPGQTFGVSVFLDKIIEDLNLSRSTVSLLYTIGTLVGSLSLPFVGRFIDRRGPRLAVILISSLFALACVWMGFVTGLVTLLIGFVLIRGLGQGALGLASLHVVNIWFVRSRGRAVGIASLGMALATALFPLVIELLLQRFDWRVAYMLLGLLVAVTILPLGALLFRSHPEAFGLVPDGTSAQKVDAANTPAEAAYTVDQARRTLTFWLFVGADILVAALSTGLVFHHYSIMAVGDLTRIEAATFFVPFALFTAVGNLLTGILIDRVQPRYLVSVMLLFLCAGLVVAPVIGSTSMILVYGGLLGLMMGMKSVISGSIYAHYFGRRHLGAIKGTAITLSVAGTAVGPLLFALGFDLFGNYGPILLLSSIPALIVAIAAPVVNPWKKDGTLR